MKRLTSVIIISALFFSTPAFAILYTGSLSSPEGSGLYSGGQTWGSPLGFRVNWEVGQVDTFTWHYKYTFNNQNGGQLGMLVSHIIISLSDNIEEDDLFNFGVDVEGFEFGTFKSDAGNPGFPVGETIFGVKINMGNAQLVAEFDSNRQPMWGDFYAKDGGQPKNYAYNTDFGVDVANLHDYAGTPVDASNNQLHKILVPNYIPEPATLLMLGLGGLMLGKRKG